MQIGKRLAALTSVAGLTLALAIGTALPASADQAEKTPLLFKAFGSCLSGAAGGVPSDSFVVIQHTNHKVMAEISLKNAPPNSTWTASLVQTPSGENCSATEGTLTTNNAGNGNLHLSEPLLPGTKDAFVLLQPASPGATATGFIASRDVVF